jgi:hypothetical protein
MLSLLVGLLLNPTIARAEYRAFELVIITPGLPDRVEISNLDPVEYRHFYPVPLNARVIYRATWMCRGNTSEHRPICPNPRAAPAPK